MAKTDFKSVTEYLATLPKETRATLERVRAAIRKAVPEGEEAISYQIPALKIAGSAVIYFAGWKEHYSVYPATKKVVSSLKEELADYELSRGTIRFPLSEPVPTKLIAAIAKIRKEEATALSAARAAKRRKVAKKTQPTKKKTKKKKTEAAKKKARPRAGGTRGR
jgi:uncharacterized protein YdhG (YjbR/CyaY superfamily)